MKKDEIQQLVETGINNLNSALAEGQSQRLKDLLTMMSRFPKYSFNNCLLIFQQRPDARQVQGFHGWKKVRRSVKKGEKGIGITAPMAYRKEESGADDKEIRGFRIVHVFDISQTEGDELPKFAEPTGNANQWLSPVEELIRENGIELLYQNLPENVSGVSSKGKIVIQRDLPPARCLTTLVHELAHEILHPDSESRRENSHSVKETEAEAVAHVVGHALGIECLDHSADYIHLHRGNADLFANSMQRIQKCASGILNDLSDSKADSVGSLPCNTTPQTAPAPTLAA